MSKSLADWQIDLAIVRGQISQINQFIIRLQKEKEQLETIQDDIKKNYLEHGE